ncbi:DUF6851 domain-containing protein [Massilia sp. LXY-6]|uniref:DUF6851 domain-containing protein n=1 Tax=Massilia sp. LXY-6 TaxID=3379823 RepID=UPI003EE413D4
MKRENFLKLGSGTVVGWNRLALQAIRTAQPGPLTSARTLALLHTCMYNAWAAYDAAARQTAHGVAVRLPRAERSAASKGIAMSHAAHAALTGQFPAQRAAFDAWMAGLGLDRAAPGGPLTPAGIGRTQAASMLDFCRRTGADVLAAPGLPPLAEPAPGRWCLAAQRLSERDGYGDDQDVRLFFALANALANAAVAGWGGAAGAGPARPAALHGSAGAAANEVIRRFAGEVGGDTRARAGSAGQELGRQVGARAFDDARRLWEGESKPA